VTHTGHGTLRGTSSSRAAAEQQQSSSRAAAEQQQQQQQEQHGRSSRTASILFIHLINTDFVWCT
jgi:hypothetical protein